jgi:hypothetical protein
VAGRFDLLQGLHPLQPGAALGQQRPAVGTAGGMGLKDSHALHFQRAVEGIGQQGFELHALHFVLGLTVHHVTCL